MPALSVSTAADREHAPRWFAWSLVAVAAAALLIRVRIGGLEFMDFDEWQQVFMASAPRWRDLAYELHAEAHPPLFYLLLKAIVSIGHAKLLYRSIAILPGAGSVVVIGLIARRLMRPPMALVCAAALALSIDAITVSIEVRQYQLMAFLLLIALQALLDMWTDRDAFRTRDAAAYGVSAALAVLCHYSAVVFLGAAALLVSARLIVDPVWRSRRDRRPLAAVAAPLVLFAYLYVTHARRLPPLGYLYDFYWRQTPGETLPAFLARNLQNFWNLFAPAGSSNPAITLPLIGVVALGAAEVLRRTTRPRDSAVVPVLLIAAMTVELAALSVLRAYPFGGLLRHQYVVGPFVILSAFVVLDRLAALLGPRAGAVLTAAAAVAMVANLALRWSSLVVFPNMVVYSRQFDDYRAAFRDARAVYVDHWGVIGYFIHTDAYPRRFVRRIDDVFEIDEYRIEAPPHGVAIFYDKSRYVLNMRHASLYRSFARCIRQSGVGELTLFFFSPGDIPFADSAETLRQIIVDTAAEQGLTTTKLVISPTTIYAGFALKQ